MATSSQKDMKELPSTPLSSAPKSAASQVDRADAIFYTVCIAVEQGKIEMRNHLNALATYYQNWVAQSLQRQAAHCANQQKNYHVLKEQNQELRTLNNTIRRELEFARQHIRTLEEQLQHQTNVEVVARNNADVVGLVSLDVSHGRADDDDDDGNGADRDVVGSPDMSKKKKIKRKRSD